MTQKHHIPNINFTLLPYIGQKMERRTVLCLQAVLVKKVLLRFCLCIYHTVPRLITAVNCIKQVNLAVHLKLSSFSKFLLHIFFKFPSRQHCQELTSDALPAWEEQLRLVPGQPAVANAPGRAEECLGAAGPLCVALGLGSGACVQEQKLCRTLRNRTPLQYCSVIVDPFQKFIKQHRRPPCRCSPRVQCRLQVWAQMMADSNDWHGSHYTVHTFEEGLMKWAKSQSLKSLFDEAFMHA